MFEASICEKTKPTIKQSKTLSASVLSQDDTKGQKKKQGFLLL
jgi:hypothetical protein